jgi:penicillin amidase
MKKIADLSSPYGKVTIHRNENGIPVIEGETRPALFFGQGWIQVRDRQIQTMLLKAIFTGRMAELLKNDESFIGIDSYMRKYRFALEMEAEWEKLSDSSRTCLLAYAEGINTWFHTHKPVWELRLAGWRHEEWSWKDSMAIGRGFGFIGLGDGQAVIEKWLTEILRHDTGMGALKELFPSICDPDYTELYKKTSIESPVFPESLQWLKIAPVFRASNNWAVGPGHSTTGHALMAGDPHLDVDRIPAIWQEVILKQGEMIFTGVNLPGVPGGVIGRTRELSWTPTYSCMDVVDFRIEECREGRYRRSDGWKEFHRRSEKITLKGSGQREKVFYENENGILQGDPHKEGFYLIENYSALSGCGAGDFEGILALLDAKSVKDGMSCFQKFQASSFNWLLADRQGNIGYQMSGRHFVRPEGTSGLLPLPAWEEKYAYRGFVEGPELPQAYNPPEGFLVTANDDRNPYGTTDPCAVYMGTYRKDRITHLLQRKDKWTAREMGAIQNDVYSLQAEAYLKRFQKLIPDTSGGAILKEWDKHYTLDSRGAVLFERFYRALLRNTFGKMAWGIEPIDFLLKKTAIFTGYFHYFDALLLKENRNWFSIEQIEKAVTEAFQEALVEPFPPLKATRSMRMGHLLFAGMFPSFLGFDAGPAIVPGSRSTVSQAQFYTSEGRPASFCPSYRFFTDMGSNEAFSALPGGATDRRFSRFYKNELQRYLRGEYKTLKIE